MKKPIQGSKDNLLKEAVTSFKNILNEASDSVNVTTGREPQYESQLKAGINDNVIPGPKLEIW